jgi:3,4-dihydroxy 2-butanone 4-phosphate synthase/GTP cyclohydrolase II
MSLRIEDWLADLSSWRLSASGRPLVTLAYAQSLDGSIAIRRGQGAAISGPETLRLTHRLRAAHQAILVGVGTVLADDPQLTVRLWDGPNPQPVILDSALRTPPTSRLVTRPGANPWIFTTPESAGSPRARLLEQFGARIFPVPLLSGQLDLSAVLNELGRQGVKSLMVEGGARVLQAFVFQRLADYALITLAPLWLGGLPVAETSLERSGAFPALAEMDVETCGSDLVIFGRLCEKSLA